MKNIWGKVSNRIRPPKTHLPFRTPDEVREEVLNYLFNTYKKALTVEDIYVSNGRLRKNLKKFGLKDNDITSSIVYLKANDWIDEKLKIYENDFEKTKVYFYRISANGINYKEGPSKFQKVEKLSGINISNNQGAIAIGDGNVVQNQYTELCNSLDKLGEAVRQSKKYNSKQKSIVKSNIDTIKTQIGKPSPDKGIIQKAWDAIKGIATVGSVLNLVFTISPLISHFLR